MVLLIQKNITLFLLRKKQHEHLLFTALFLVQIAAASLEKLFQQLTSPHFEHQDFMRVFLLTHSCFTTSQEVLTALLNCIKGPEDNDRMSPVGICLVHSETCQAETMYPMNTSSLIGGIGSDYTHNKNLSKQPCP